MGKIQRKQSQPDRKRMFGNGLSFGVLFRRMSKLQREELKWLWYSETRFIAAQKQTTGNLMRRRLEHTAQFASTAGLANG